MTIALGEPTVTGIQRGRGGFLRNSADVPYVSDPSGATVKSGERKGEIKRLQYGSPSNRGKQIENTTNLVKWGERRVVLGLGLDPEIGEMCRRLATLEVDSDEYKTAADAIIIRAKDVAKANLAAARGTHVHALTEDFDESRDWVLRAEAGEIVGLEPELQTALVEGWNRMLEREQLEVLAVEASCVDDAWRLAGTLDRIVRTGKALRFARHGGEIVEIPAGTVLVLDVKTSNKRLDRNGVVQYWNAFSIQVASYAQSVPYDTETEVRSEWPWPIDQAHALIAHPDLETCEWELIHCDLVAGREHGGECVVQAKAWETRTDVFSVAQLEVEGVSEQSPTGATCEAKADTPSTTLVSESAGSGMVPAADSDTSFDDFDAPMVPTARCHVCDKDLGHELDDVWEAICDDCYAVAQAKLRCGTYDAIGQCELTREHDGPHLDPRLHHHFGEGVTCDCRICTNPEIHGPYGDDVIEHETRRLTDDFDAPMMPTVAPAAALLPPQPRAESFQWLEASRAAALVPTPTLTVNHDEGTTVYLDEAFNALEAEYASLDQAARAWIKMLTEQAMKGGVSFHSHGNRTERRWWIIKGLVALGLANLAEDEVLRALVAVALGSDAPLFAAITPGHAVGALGAAEAEDFAGLVDQLNHGRLIGAIDDGGVFVLRAVAA